MKEKWSKGKHGGTVVSDIRTKMTVPDGQSHNDVDYYGGYLVAESIPKQEYVNLISAAPVLLEACEFALSVQKNSHGIFDTSDRLNADKLEAAIAKAKGESDANND